MASDSPNNPADRLIWIDLEMTGLDTTSDSILEIAIVVTDFELEEIAVGPVFAIHHDEETLKAMDDWNRRHHRDSGLWERSLESDVDYATAERKTLEFLKQWTERGLSPMCGNTICQDRRFLARQMPELEAWFHYRNLDVSTLKELASRWAPSILEKFSKESRHEALSDIRESIAELKYYRGFMGELGGGSPGGAKL